MSEVMSGVRSGVVSGADMLLSVEGVSKHFRVGGGLLRAVEDVSFSIGETEILGLVGESGCGKSTTARLVLQLETPTSGVIRFNGVDINTARRSERSTYRRSVQAVLQDPYSSLNPRSRVRSIIAEPLVVNSDLSRREIDRRVAEVVEAVSLPAEAPSLYPHEFSGGQRQRIALARSLILRPSLIVLDEPVSGLDMSMKAQILNLLRDLQQDYGMAYLLISHSLADVRYLCDRVMVMYLGRIVESGPVEQVLGDPLHPYTKALLSASLPLDATPDHGEELPIAGEVPSPLSPPTGCAFHTRCPVAIEQCPHIRPALTTITPLHATACHLHQPLNATGLPRSS
jgi:oligopeptide/dipeptide ABC transporter ATP-binding protein